MPYDATKKLDHESWLALDLRQRQEQVEVYHVAPGSWHPPIVNPPRHAMVHVVVESQIARGSGSPAYAKLQQLSRQGLHRHEAIHALGSAYIRHADAVDQGRVEMDDVDRSALAKLAGLTATSWALHGKPSRSRSARRPKPVKNRPKPKRPKDRKKKKKKR